MRLYVLVKGIEPEVEIYLCKEGMARFCTEDYKDPTTENLRDLYGHLTNFTLNKDNENYVNIEGKSCNIYSSALLYYISLSLKLIIYNS